MSDSIQLPLLGPVSKRTAGVFAAGLALGLSTVYLPTLLTSSLPALRALLFLAYPAATAGIALTTWWATRHQPSLSPLASLRADSPLRYTFLLLTATLLALQLLFARAITHSLWAPALVYIGQLLAHFPLIAHSTLAAAAALGADRPSPAAGCCRHWRLGLWATFVGLVCVGCGFPYVGSEYALSRGGEAGLAWYVLRLVVECCYAVMLTAGVVDSKAAAVGGVRVEVLMAAHVARIALWAALAYVCRLFPNQHAQ